MEKATCTYNLIVIIGSVSPSVYFEEQGGRKSPTDTLATIGNNKEIAAVEVQYWPQKIRSND